MGVSRTMSKHENRRTLFDSAEASTPSSASPPSVPTSAPSPTSAPQTPTQGLYLTAAAGCAVRFNMQSQVSDGIQKEPDPGPPTVHTLSSISEDQFRGVGPPVVPVHPPSRANERRLRQATLSDGPARDRDLPPTLPNTKRGPHDVSERNMTADKKAQLM